MSLLSLLLLGALWGAPGFAASRWLWRRSGVLERAATSLLLGIALAAPPAFLWSLLAERPLGVLTVAAGSAAMTGLFVALAWWTPSESEVRSELTAGGAWLLAALPLCLALVLGTRAADSEATELFSSCAHMSCLYLMEDGGGGGLRFWDPDWGQAVTHLFAHQAGAPGFDLRAVLQDQRPGSASTLVQALVSSGSAGFVFATWAYELLVLLFAILLTQRGARLLRATLPVWGIAASAAFVWIGAHCIAGYAVNENLLAMGLGMGALWLLLDEAAPRGRRALLAGIVLGHLVATRPVCAALMPAVWVLLKPRSAMPWLLLGALLGALTLLVSNIAVFGELWTHPAMRWASSPQRFAGFDFVFHPLGWPVSERLLRPPSAPFPMLLGLPLTHLQHFGVPVIAMALVGVAQLLRWRRTLLAALLLWAAPIYGLLLLIVSLDAAKQSYALMALAPLPLFVGAGLGASLQLRNRGLLLWAGIAAALALLPYSLRWVELEVDARPHHDGGQAPLDDAALREARDALASAHLWPRIAFRGGFAGGQLLNAGPPRRSAQDVIEGPVVVWRAHQPSFEIDFMARLMSEGSMPPRLFAYDEGVEHGWQYLALPLRVDAPVAELRARTRFDGERLEVELRGEGEGAGGWLNLGFSYMPLHRLRALSVTLDGEPISLRYIVLDAYFEGDASTLDAEYHGRLQQQARLRLASNVGWQLSAAERPPGLRVTPGDALEIPGSRCHALRFDGEGWRYRLRRSAEFPPPRYEGCAEQALPGD